LGVGNREEGDSGVKKIMICILWLLPVLVLTAKPVAAQTAWKPFERFDFRHRVLTLAQTGPMTLLDLKYMRGLVFGRHGRRFDEAAIQDFLKTRPWYRPSPTYRVTDLNADERLNMDAIKTAEARRHSHPGPGDMRFFTARRLTPGQVRTDTTLDLQIMAAEVEAWRGRPFTANPWLREYFAERYWYHPRADYGIRDLSPTEQANLALLQRSLRDSRHLALAPGDMGRFRAVPITAAQLRGLGLYDLRVLRNEIFARRGGRFHTAWLQSYFDGQPWYRPQPSGNPVALSPVESRNAKIIADAEARLHQQVSTAPLPPSLLEGLSADDARRLRNEVYARHGRVFGDPWLQGYFQSQPWYKPDAHFREASLSPIERANVAVIKRYEERGRTQLRQAAA